MSQPAVRPPPKGGGVKVRVLPKGAGKLFTGALEEGVFVTYPKGAVLEATEDAALVLEDRGLVEIL